MPRNARTRVLVSAVLLLTGGLHGVADSKPLPPPNAAQTIQKAAKAACKELEKELEKHWTLLELKLDLADASVQAGAHFSGPLADIADALGDFQHVARGVLLQVYLSDGFYAATYNSYAVAENADPVASPKAFAEGAGGALEKARERIASEVDRAFARIEKRLVKTRKLWEEEGLAFAYVIESSLREVDGMLYVPSSGGTADFAPCQTAQVCLHTVVAGGRLDTGNDNRVWVLGRTGPGSQNVEVQLIRGGAPPLALTPTVTVGAFTANFSPGVAEGFYVAAVRQTNGSEARQSVGLR